MYIRSGLIYLTRVKNIMKHNSIKGKKSFGIITPPSRAFNIDDISDFKIAELVKKIKFIKFVMKAILILDHHEYPKKSLKNLKKNINFKI